MAGPPTPDRHSSESARSSAAAPRWTGRSVAPLVGALVMLFLIAAAAVG